MFLLDQRVNVICKVAFFVCSKYLEIPAIEQPDHIYCSLDNEPELNEKCVLEVARVTEAIMGNDLYFSRYFVKRFKYEADPVNSRSALYCLCFVIKVTESEIVLGEGLVIIFVFN
jgi:hypothetical protein